MQNTPAAPHVGALIDPTRPRPYPRSAVLLGPDGAVLRRTTRHSFTRARLVRLGPDGQPDPRGTVELGGGAITQVAGPDPEPVRSVPAPSSVRQVSFQVALPGPELMQLLTGGLALPAGVGR